MNNFLRTPLPLLVFELGMALLCISILVQMNYDGKALQTVEMAPVVVTRTDPYPCISDPVVRASCDRQGCINRCEER